VASTSSIVEAASHAVNAANWIQLLATVIFRHPSILRNVIWPE
jgi:hypothetical protein